MADITLAQRLLTLRLSRKLCQKEIAFTLGLPIDTYRSYERGKKMPVKMSLPEIIRRVEAMEAQP